jgi:hypothetical protein
MNHTTREILTAFQYLIIGLIALGIVLRWYGQYAPYWQMLVWLIIAGGATILRLILMVGSEWFRDTRWQSIRRRNWD